jgi:hypothetical protein
MARTPELQVIPGFSYSVRGKPEPQETGDGPTKLRRRQCGGLARLLDKKLPGKGRRRIFIGPTGCGKSKLAKALALADLRKGLKVIVSVPQHVVVEGFNELSEPLDGITVESLEIVIGYRPCLESPIGVCVYSDRAMSIPGQLEAHAWGVKHAEEQLDQVLRFTATAEDVMHNWSSATGTDACLFCGTPMDPHADQEGRQLLPPSRQRPARPLETCFAGGGVCPQIPCPICGYKAEKTP